MPFCVRIVADQSISWDSRSCRCQKPSPLSLTGGERAPERRRGFGISGYWASTRGRAHGVLSPLPRPSLSCCHSLSSAHGATRGRHRSRPGPRPVSLPTRGSESVLELFQPESWGTWPWPKRAGRVLSHSEISRLLGRSHEHAARPRSSTCCSGRLVEIGRNSPGPAVTVRKIVF